MTLTLLAVSLNDRPLSQPITAHFDSRGGTIGRADHNTMALPDPERHVSRLQAEIVASGTGFLIRNVGAANPITVAGRAVARGDSAALAHLDEVRIGGYLLQVDCSEQDAALDITRGRAMLTGGFADAVSPAARSAPLPLSQPSAAPPAAFVEPLVGGPSAAGANPFADLLGPAAGGSATPSAASDPFAGLLGPPPAAGAGQSAADAFGMPAPAFRGLQAEAFARPSPAAATDPFAGLMPPPAGVSASSAGLAAAAAPPAPRLPDDFDPFAPPPAPSLAARAAAAPSSDPFADLMPVAAPPSIDSLFALKSAHADPLAHFMAGTLPAAAGTDAAAGAGGVSTDPLLALFGDGAAPPPAPAPAQSDHLPAVHAAFKAPRVVMPAAPPSAPLPVNAPADVDISFPTAPSLTNAPAHLPAPAPVPTPGAMPAPNPPSNPESAPAAVPAAAAPRPAAAPGAAAGRGEAQRLWAALCEGAGIAVDVPPGSEEDRLRDVGRILRNAVDGALRLMAVRASTKHELRAAVTVIQARGNNPLKFSPDAKSGLEYLLQPGVRGFLDGPAAMDDAMHDLVGHSIGTVAGMRAAIDGMLDRFAPEQLEAKLVGNSMLDSLLPSNRKAKLWDLYLQHHDAIREEAQEDFQTLFGKAFLVAYEQQIDRLQRKPG